MIGEIDALDYINKKKIENLVTKIKNELDGPITYFSLDRLCDSLNLPVPPVQEFIKFLRKNQFPAFSTHFASTGIRFMGTSKEIKRLLSFYVNQKKRK